MLEANVHLNWLFPVLCSLFPVTFEEFRYPNLNAEQLKWNSEQSDKSAAEIKIIDVAE
ncbi:MULTISPECIES: hypothetical protein [Moorena]|uniref:Uncharacterized protein n=1 Tax=Moorena producens 3L TaxID=489825 RepID=F4XK35_9CYAN|nr:MULTISPECIES: hypothetical protein [Moorena]NEQ16005.1 hypothetical protein [Moorena sp. SIO3E2]EGJ34994.1 hypothetical protein LYNGBM3L_10960 [Moorena producens 3L]NEP34196.1 hypothetical protein [Moorena sp. SIO3B2]NEQ04536.1 hypothetical protein [Moorena sp. SIO4E2]NER86929.1 hypothetical protein [Moorena sp. SIO3A2]